MILLEEHHRLKVITCLVGYSRYLPFNLRIFDANLVDIGGTFLIVFNGITCKLHKVQEVE